VNGNISANFDRTDLRTRLSRRRWDIHGALLGASFGVVEAFVAKLLGFEVFFRGMPTVWTQIVFHALLCSCVGFLAGRVYDRHFELQQALEIIRCQYEDLRSNQQQLVQSEKMAVIGRLAASVAHEIRNPLGIMRSSAGLVADDLPPDHPSQKPLEFIRDEIDRLSGLIESHLVYARPKKPLLARADLNALLDRALEFMAPEFRKRKIRILRAYGEHLPVAHVDPDQMHQVFLGLLLNASQAVSREGTITIGTAVSPEEGKDSRHLSVSITDTGPGIDPASLEKIFEPFFTTKNGGTGLGLSVAKQIINGHGGTIGARSEPGQGATMTIELPVPAPEVTP